MTSRTKKCTATIRRGRLDKAKQFAETARLIEGNDALIDAYVTNCVHAGIAAADVICCARLGEHAIGTPSGCGRAPSQGGGITRQGALDLARHEGGGRVQRPPCKGRGVTMDAHPNGWSLSVLSHRSHRGWRCANRRP